MAALQDDAVCWLLKADLAHPGVLVLLLPLLDFRLSRSLGRGSIQMRQEGDARAERERERERLDRKEAAVAPFTPPLLVSIPCSFSSSPSLVDFAAFSETPVLGEQGSD